MGTAKNARGSEEKVIEINMNGQVLIYRGNCFTITSCAMSTAKKARGSEEKVIKINMDGPPTLLCYP